MRIFTFCSWVVKCFGIRCVLNFSTSISINSQQNKMYLLTLSLFHLFPSSISCEATDWVLTKPNSGTYTRIPEHDCAKYTYCLGASSLATNWEVAWSVAYLEGSSQASSQSKWAVSCPASRLNEEDGLHKQKLILVLREVEILRTWQWAEDLAI